MRLVTLASRHWGLQWQCAPCYNALTCVVKHPPLLLPPVDLPPLTHTHTLHQALQHSRHMPCRSYWRVCNLVHTSPSLGWARVRLGWHTPSHASTQPPPLQTSHPSKRCCTQSPTGAFKLLQPPHQDSPSLQHYGCMSMVGCTHPAIHQHCEPLTPSTGLTEPMDEDSATALGNTFKLTCKELRDVRLWAGSTAKPHSLSHSPTSPP